MALPFLLALGFGVSGLSVASDTAQARSVASAEGSDSDIEHDEEEDEADGDDEEDEDEPGLRVGADGVEYRSPFGDIYWKLGGRLHADGGVASVDGDRAYAISLARGLVRRARVEFTASLNQYWHFDLSIEVADRDSPVQEALIGYELTPAVAITVGNFKEPFSFEQIASSNDLSFLERSAANALAAGRSFGVGIAAHGDRWTAQAGLFGGDINNGIHRNGAALGARATYALVKDDDLTVHLGAALNHRRFDRRQDFEVAAQPETRIYRRDFVEAEAEDARSVSRAGLEFAYLSGPFRFQAEYMGMRIQRDEARPLLHHGGYILASYMLTGQSQRYTIAPDRRRGFGYGVFGGVDLEDKDRVSRGGWGAWEVAGRAAYLNLAEGGSLRTISAALNWRPEKNVRIMANVIGGFTGRHPDTDRRASAAIAQMRLQIAF